VTPAARILVTHPGRQHSHEAALALQEAGLLAGYWAGVPSARGHFEGAAGRLLRPFVRYAAVDLDERLARWIPFPPVLRRLSELVLPRRLAERADFFACRAFDRWVAARLGEVEAGAVLACEISALETFQRARERGWRTLLDAPSFHHAAQDRLHGFRESPRLHRRIVEVKDREIELADAVFTASELARGTYLAAGVPPEKVHAVPLGADLDLFTPGGDLGEADGAIRFAFAGASVHRKGFDLLVEAFGRVHRQVPAARLRVVGPRGELAALLSALDPGSAVAVGPVSQPELAAELRRADCLVLPSRNDSYGMVVAEALASGTPVIVSEMVGAKDLVEEGRTGWLVPADDPEALAQRMLACALDPQALRAMRPAARERALSATWESYRRRFAALVGSLLGEVEAVTRSMG
jgi:glycosyltransferase involved in cell wall biosynthesis